MIRIFSSNRLLFLYYTQKNIFFISFEIVWNMIVVTVSFLILNQMEFHLAQNQRFFQDNST